MFQLFFCCITLYAFFLFWCGTGKNKKVLVLSIVWMLIIGPISYSGYFENTSATPPRFLLVIIGAIGLSVCFYRMIRRNEVNRKYLLAVHAVRLPVEVALYQLFLQKKIPVLMTFEGWNFDIVMGVSAILILIYPVLTRKQLSKHFCVFWNIAGLIFLTIIVVIAALSSPLPFQQFAFNQPNVAMLQFPFIYLPAYIVPAVFLSHILMLKRNPA